MTSVVKRCQFQNKVQLTEDRADYLLRISTELTQKYRCRHCNTWHVSSNKQMDKMIKGDNVLGRRLVEKIRAGRSRSVKKISSRMHIHTVEFGGISYSVEYNKETKTCRYVRYEKQEVPFLSR